jgi:hypothetical protein
MCLPAAAIPKLFSIAANLKSVKHIRPFQQQPIMVLSPQQPTSGLINTSQPQAFSTTTNHSLVNTSQLLVCSTAANFWSIQQ